MDHLAGKDFFDRGLFGRFSLQGYLAGIIALGEDAHEAVGVRDQQGANVLVRHHLNGVETTARNLGQASLNVFNGFHRLFSPVPDFVDYSNERTIQTRSRISADNNKTGPAY
jgi:hypothetical protein